MAMLEIKNQDELFRICTECYKMIDFSGEVVQARVTSKLYSPSTVKQIHSKIRSYVYGNVKNTKQLSQSAYDKVQSLIDTHYAKLTPKQEERARAYQKLNRSQKSPVKTMKLEAEEKQQEPTKIELSNETLKQIKSNACLGDFYGIYQENIIKVLPNEDTLVGYLSACDDFRATQVQGVKFKMFKYISE